MESVDRGTGMRTYPVLNWSAIFAGWLVATGIAALLYVGGLALGFSAFNPYQAAENASGMSIAAAAWMVLTWTAALFLGGMFASWFDGHNDTEMGVMRGLTVWGLAITATGLLMASGMAEFLYVATPIDADMAGVDPSVLTRYTAMSMWVAFGSAALSMVASAAGGWVGAHHIGHVYHLRTFEPRMRTAR